MINNRKEFNTAIEILNTPSHTRSYEDLEFLANYLLYLNDFRKCIIKLNQVVKIQLCRALKLEKYKRKQIIYNKGDPSDRYYLIMRGNVDGYSVDNTGKLNLICQFEAGKQIGERGIILGTPRAITMIAGDKTTYLITLTAQEFKQMLGDFVLKFLDQRLKFVKMYIPNIKSFSITHKERIAYAFNIESYKRGDIVIEKNSFSDILYYVYEGECSISVPQGIRFRNIVKIGVGNCFGEECVFFGLKSHWKINVSSEICSIAEITRADLLTLFPQETIETIKNTYQLKNEGRNLWVQAAIKHIPGPNSSSEKDSSFPQATKYARKRLVQHVERSKPQTINTNRLSPSNKIALRKKLDRIKDSIRSPKQSSESPTCNKDNIFTTRTNRLKLSSESTKNQIRRSFTPKLGSSKDSEFTKNRIRRSFTPKLGSSINYESTKNRIRRSLTPKLGSSKDSDANLSFIRSNNLSTPKVQSITPRYLRIGKYL